MEQAITNLGTPELHKRHSVMIEGGKFPRSKVMDQCIFDRYLMNGEINMNHHRSAETLLSMAAKAGMWAKGAGIDNSYSDLPKQSKVFFGMTPFGNALRYITNECGIVHCELTKAVIIRNKDIRRIAEGLELFREAMDFVGQRIVGIRPDPLRHLK